MMGSTYTNEPERFAGSCWRGPATFLRKAANPGPSANGFCVRGLRSCKSSIAAAVLPLLAALALSSAGAQDSATSPSPAPFAGAIVSEWAGEVHLQVPNTAQAKPERGQVLPAGTLVETGKGSLLVVLRTDESEILVQPYTRLVLKEPAPGSWNALEIVLGRVRAYIRKRTGGAPSFQMGTPSAVIAVRGTRFDVEVNGHGVSEVDVFDGLVEVAGTGVADGSVQVSPGFSTRVGPGKAPERPVPTPEIRPGVDAPEGSARDEFSRERNLTLSRGLEDERGERPGQDRDEAGETRGAPDVD